MIAGAGAGEAGVVVVGVDPNGAAADHGFKEGDVILEVAGKGVANPGVAFHYVAMPLGSA
jgi:serine protease Do